MNDFKQKVLDMFNIELSEKQLKQFNQYYKLLVSWNEKMNLTSITEEDEVYNKHFVDSLSILTSEMFSKKDITLCDVGSGAGFPSIPLKIVFPEMKITIIDALNKRITFLNEVIKTLQLQNIEAIHARAEEYVNENRNSFDIVTARAVARLNVLSELCIPLTKIDGYFISMKGQNGLIEVEDSEEAFKKLGCSLVKTVDFKLPNDEGNRVIVVIKNNKKTAVKYPRNYGQIKKRPL